MDIKDELFEIMKSLSVNMPYIDHRNRLICMLRNKEGVAEHYYIKVFEENELFEVSVSGKCVTRDHCKNIGRMVLLEKMNNMMLNYHNVRIYIGEDGYLYSEVSFVFNKNISNDFENSVLTVLSCLSMAIERICCIRSDLKEEFGTDTKEDELDKMMNSLLFIDT